MVMIASLMTSARFLPNDRGLLYLAPTLSLTTMVLTSEKMIVSLISLLQMTTRMVLTPSLQSGKRCLLFPADIQAPLVPLLK